MPEYYSDDITWCNDHTCNVLKCEMNPKNIRPAFRERSYADYKDTEYCMKAKKGAK